MGFFIVAELFSQRVSLNTSELPAVALTQNFPATANCTFPAVFHNLLSAAHNHFSPLWS